MMSYFVRDPNFFVNITDRNFASTTFGRFFLFNHIASSTCGLFFVPLMFYMILYESPKSMSNFRKILLISASVDFLIWIVYSLGPSRTRYVDQIALHAFIGPILLLPFEFQVVVHVLNLVVIVATFVVLPLPFWYRDHMLRYGTPSNGHLFRYISLIVLILSIDVTVFVMSVIRADRSITYEAQWFVEVPIPPLFVVNPHNNQFASASLIYRRFELLGGFLISLFIAWRSYRLIKKQQNGMVSRSRSMDQFTRLLFAQMLIPTLSLFLPLLIIGILVYFGANDEITQNIVAVFLSWLPCINSITTLIVIVPYRQAITNKLRGVTRQHSQSSVMAVQPVSITHFTTSRS